MSGIIIPFGGAGMGDDPPHILTLAQTMHRSRYSVREIAILMRFHDFPLPVDGYCSTQAYFDDAEIESWRRNREQRLYQLLI